MESRKRLERVTDPGGPGKLPSVKGRIRAQGRQLPGLNTPAEPRIGTPRTYLEARKKYGEEATFIIPGGTPQEGHHQEFCQATDKTCTGLGRKIPRLLKGDG